MLSNWLALWLPDLLKEAARLPDLLREAARLADLLREAARLADLLRDAARLADRLRLKDCDLLCEREALTLCERFSDILLIEYNRDLLWLIERCSLIRLMLCERLWDMLRPLLNDASRLPDLLKEAARLPDLLWERERLWLCERFTDSLDTLTDVDSHCDADLLKEAARLPDLLWERERLWL